MTETLRPGATVVASAVHPVFYVRSTSFSRCYSINDPDDYRLDYLKSLALILTGDRSVSLPMGTTFRWGGPVKYRSDAEAFLLKMEALVEGIRLSLLNRKLLTLEESKAGPHVVVDVIDERTENRTPLPTIDWRLTSKASN